MRIIDISKSNPIVDHFMVSLRDRDLQQDRFLFQSTIKRLGQLLAFEASKYLEYSEKQVITPFSKCILQTISSELILVAIVRAGIMLQEGVESIIQAKHSILCSCEKDRNKIRHARFSQSCDYANSSIIISEPIMTSASSIICCINELVKYGELKQIIILNIISTPLAIKNLETINRPNMFLLTCAIDEYTLNVRGTIPGLGDVGDLLYGPKKHYDY